MRGDGHNLQSAITGATRSQPLGPVDDFLAGLERVVLAELIRAQSSKQIARYVTQFLAWISDRELMEACL
ncbi:MAG: hypothetical protein ACSLFQ_22895 [Thermoanaerobaculia bacterium]